MDTQRCLGIAVLAVSDTRTPQTDDSGNYLASSAEQAGHKVHAQAIVPDDTETIRSQLKQWIQRREIDVILISGGTGFGARDVTPEAVLPLLERNIEGFGELFRSLSYAEIGSSTVQSRALAGTAEHTLIFCMPGSTSACRLAWEKILLEQLDSRHKPCNFIHALAPE